MPRVLAGIRARLCSRAAMLLGAEVKARAACLVGHALRQVSSRLPLTARALGTAPTSALPALPACT